MGPMPSPLRVREAGEQTQRKNHQRSSVTGLKGGGKETVV